MADVEELAAKFRRQLLKDQQGPAVELTEGYARVWGSLRNDLKSLERKIQLAQLTGTAISPNWLRLQSEYTRLLNQLELQLVQLAPVAANHASSVAQNAVSVALQNQAASASLAGPAAEAGLTKVNDVAVRRIVGSVARGPLEQLLVKYAAVSKEKAASILIESVARGYAPSKTARLLEKTVGLNRTKALTIVRTEQMRAYRAATREAYLANPAVTRWVWSSRLIIGRTCGFCWGMHNSVHPTTEIMATHPNCMCVMMPFVDDLDYGETGTDRFLALSNDEQEQVLGIQAAEEVRSGRLDLEDFVSKRRHPDWGMVGGIAPLDQARKNHSNSKRKSLRYVK